MNGEIHTYLRKQWVVVRWDADGEDREGNFFEPPDWVSFTWQLDPHIELTSDEYQQVLREVREDYDEIMQQHHDDCLLTDVI